MQLHQVALLGRGGKALVDGCCTGVLCENGSGSATVPDRAAILLQDSWADQQSWWQLFENIFKKKRRVVKAMKSCKSSKEWGVGIGWESVSPENRKVKKRRSAGRTMEQIFTCREPKSKSKQSMEDSMLEQVDMPWKRLLLQRPHIRRLSCHELQPMERTYTGAEGKVEEGAAEHSVKVWLQPTFPLR